MEIQIESVLNRGAVDLGDQPACPCQRHRIQSRLLADLYELVRGASRVPPASTANIQPKLTLYRREAALERADHTGCDSRGVPVHSHDCTERLEPEGMCQATQHLVAP